MGTYEVTFAEYDRFGLFRMHGNVSELLRDRYIDSYANMKTDGSAQLHRRNLPCMNFSHPGASPTFGEITRGGSWESPP